MLRKAVRRWTSYHDEGPSRQTLEPCPECYAPENPQRERSVRSDIATCHVPLLFGG